MMGSKILLADDSITIQKVVNLTFADEGIDVVTVSNGEMAERRLAEINPDLVLADIFMPGRNGYELCQYVKESPQFKNTPVVLLVGAFEPFDQAEAKRVRADAHLTKPFESRTLVDTVRRLIQSRPRTGPLHSGPLQTAGVKETRRLDEQPAAQHVASPFDSTVSYGAPGPVEFSGFGQASPSFPLIDDTPPAAPQAPQTSSQPEPFSVGYNPMWQGQETGAEHNTQELPTISIDLGEPGEPAEQHRVPEFNPSSLTAEADAAESAAQEQGFSFSMVQPPSESQTVAAPVEPIPFEPTVAAQFDSVQPVPEPPPLEDFVPEQLSSPEPTGFAVPSLFEDAQNPMIDFDVVGEEAVGQERVSPAEDLPVPPPIPLQESAPVAFEVDFGDTLPLPPTLEQRGVSHADQTALPAPVEEPQSLVPAWPQSQEEAPLAVSFAPDSATAFEVSGIETAEPVKSEPEPEPQPLKSEGYFTEEEPLGDVLTEEALTEEALTEVEP
ncbi:MAG: response regulator, partial [Blastocatellia bacterium]